MINKNLKESSRVKKEKISQYSITRAFVYRNDLENPENYHKETSTERSKNISHFTKSFVMRVLHILMLEFQAIIRC